MNPEMKLNAAIVRALRGVPENVALTVLTGAFVGLVVELGRRQGHDMSREISIDGGQLRDITIHAEKLP